MLGVLTTCSTDRPGHRERAGRGGQRAHGGEPHDPQLILILGEARGEHCGGSWRWVLSWSRTLLYVATARAFDDEMRARMRGAPGRTAGRLADVGSAVADRRRWSSDRAGVVLLNCMTLLASSALLVTQGMSVYQEGGLQLRRVAAHWRPTGRGKPRGSWSATVGAGPGAALPAGPRLPRRLGHANQTLAAAADGAVHGGRAAAAG